MRIARLALHLVRGLFTAALLFPFQSQATRDREIREWAFGVFDILALRLTIDGDIAKARPLMLVANHVSWLDIFAMQSVSAVRFV